MIPLGEKLAMSLGDQNFELLCKVEMIDFFISIHLYTGERL